MNVSSEIAQAGNPGYSLPVIRVARLLCLLLAAWSLFAAEHHGEVRADGLPIPGATVKARMGEQTLLAYTDENGHYSFPDLPPGNWRVVVQMFGFSEASRIVGSPSDEPLAWELSLSERLEEAPAGGGDFARLRMRRTAESEMMANLESATLGADLPAGLERDANQSFLVSGSLSQGLGIQQQMGVLFGRGMKPGGSTGFDAGGPGSTPSIFGGRQAGTTAGLDGRGGGRSGIGGGRPGMGAGRTIGGGMRGRGGGGRPGSDRGERGERGEGRERGSRGGRPDYLGGRNVAAFGNRKPRGMGTIRGRASLSLNNSAIDARPFSLSGQEIPQASYSKFRFSIGAGGQLRIPKLIDSKKTFFFANYSGSRSRNPFDQITTVPSAAERIGDFSRSINRAPTTIYDPTTGLPFPGNITPSARISPTSTGLLEYIPLPNLPGSVQNYQFTTSVPNNTDNLGVRLNHSLTSRDQLSGSFNLQSRRSERAQVYGYLDEVDGLGMSANFGWNRTLTPTLINSIKAAYSYYRSETLPYFAHGPDVAGELGIEGTAPGDINNGPPNLSFTNFGALTGASPALRRDRAISLTESVTWIRGRHTLKFGVEYRHNQINNLTEDNGRGSYSFSGLVTSAFDDTGNPAPGTGFDMADYLLGFPQSSTVRWGNPDMYFRASNFNGFVLDDWRVRSGLSLNFGVRYEYSEPLYEKYDRMANLDIASGFTDVAVVTPNDPGPYGGAFPRGLVESDKKNFSPRIGLAWKPWAKKSTLVRAGYGIYYNGSVYNTIASRLGQQPPFANTNSFTTSITNPLTINEGFLGSPGTDVTNTFAVGRDYLVGYAQTWNFKVQHSLPLALVLELGYLGTKGTRLDVQRLPNQAPPGSPVDSEDRRPIPYSVGFTYDSSDANSIYHAGQARLMRRFRRGLSFMALYTWSKSIDNVSSYGGGQAVVAQNARDLAAERGLSSFDQRHTLNLSFMISSPFGEGRSRIAVGGWGKALLEDWNLNGSVVASTGTPLTATVLGNRADSGGTGVVGSGRADATGLPVSSGNGFLSPLAFRLPPPENYGNAGRNTVPGPGSVVLNLSLGRSFPLGSDRRQVEFRIDASNLLNSVNYSRFGTTVNASNFGLATGTNPMRSITAQLRFRF